MSTFTPASSKQADFITKLLTERVVPESLKAAVIAAAQDASTYSTRVASGFITSLLGLPKAAPAAPVAPENPWAPVHAALAVTPVSFYALDTVDLALANLSPRTRSLVEAQPLLFVQVKTYTKGSSRYPMLVRLLGAPGDFSRFRFPTPEDALAVLNLISREPLAAIKRFGEHYKCCGKCSAPLTDETSRALGFGPTCASYLRKMGML